MKILNRIKHAIRNYYVLYADSTEMLNKAQKFLRPLPQGCELVKLTDDNKELYKCTIGDIDKVLQFKEEAWGVVNNNSIIAYILVHIKGKNLYFLRLKIVTLNILKSLLMKGFEEMG